MPNDLWILGWPVSCEKMRDSIKGLRHRDPNHTCIVGSGDCSYERYAIRPLRHFSDRWTSHVCQDPRIPGDNNVRRVVELECGTNREALEAKLPVEMSEEMKKALGRFLGEPAVFLQEVVSFDHDGDSLNTPDAQAQAAGAEVVVVGSATAQMSI